MGGKASYLSQKNVINKFCFFKNYTTINFLPMVHRNTFNFMGMGVIQDYLIWRETPSFFTALHKSGML